MGVFTTVAMIIVSTWLLAGFWLLHDRVNHQQTLLNHRHSLAIDADYVVKLTQQALHFQSHFPAQLPSQGFALEASNLADQTALRQLLAQLVAQSNQVMQQVLTTQVQGVDDTQTKQHKHALSLVTVALKQDIARYLELSAPAIEPLIVAAKPTLKAYQPSTGRAASKPQLIAAGEAVIASAQRLGSESKQQFQAVLSASSSNMNLLLSLLTILAVFVLVWNSALIYFMRRSVTANAAMAKQMRQLANMDPLTGLFNRRAIQAKLADGSVHTRLNPKELGRAGRTQFRTSDTTPTNTCMLVIDLDHFKRYNDTHGHAFGDAHLKACAAAWQHSLRGSDLLGRIGGEEFIVIMPHCTAEQAMATALRLQHAMPAGTGFSGGVALCGEGEGFDAWFARADAALYQAKAQGRAQTLLAP
jgi:diguanylate cyclase (GGDEF)-like protein